MERLKRVKDKIKAGSDLQPWTYGVKERDQQAEVGVNGIRQQGKQHIADE